MDNPLSDQQVDIYSHFSYGIYLVSSFKEDKVNAQIANVVFQITADPARMAVGINTENLTHDYIQESKVFAIIVVDQDAPIKFIEHFGLKSGHFTDKFVNYSYQKGKTGCPIIEDHTISAVEVQCTDQITIASHTLFIGDVINMMHIKEGIPLTYHYYNETLKGKSPDGSPMDVSQRNN